MRRATGRLVGCEQAERSSTFLVERSVGCEQAERSSTFLARSVSIQEGGTALRLFTPYIKTKARPAMEGRS